jgi:hypothetical protein
MNTVGALSIAIALVIGLSDIASALRHMEINLIQTIKVQDQPTPPARVGKAT